MTNKKGLYLHIPFCVKKCHYCDFLSAPAIELERKSYIFALKEEILAYQKHEYCADTIFFGGGTPSILSVEEIKMLIEALYQVFTISKQAEITIECNPETVDKGKLSALREMGFNRVSFGLQSALDQELVTLGRVHNYDKFLNAYQIAKEEGFSNINIDLMSAIPGQTMESWEETLRKVLTLNPSHISAYSLIIEEGTVFYNKQEELDLPGEETERLMYYKTGELLSKAGYQQYEISNYAKPGKESRHNLKYWSLEEYIGMGLGASSYLEGARFHNPASMEAYKRDCGCLAKLRQEEEYLAESQQMEEFCFLGLRKRKGIGEKEFSNRFGQEIDTIYGKVIEKFQKMGLLISEDGRIFLSRQGIDVSNQVFAEFLL